MRKAAKGSDSSKETKDFLKVGVSLLNKLEKKIQRSNSKSSSSALVR